MRFAAICLLISLQAAGQTPKVVLTTTYNIDAKSGALTPFQQASYQYTRSGKFASRSYFNWDKVNKQWSLSVRNQTTYDERDSLLKEEGWSWQSYPDTLRYYSLTTYQYDAQHRLVERRQRTTTLNLVKGPLFLQIFIYDNKTTYTLNSLGCRISEKFEGVQNGNIVSKSLSVNAVDANCHVLNSTYYTDYDNPNSALVYDTYEYTNDKLTRFQRYTLPGMVLMYEQTFQYNAQGLITFKNNKSYRETTTYNAGGDILSIVGEYSPDAGAHWYPASRYTYDYANGKLVKTTNEYTWDATSNFFWTQLTDTKYFGASAYPDSTVSVSYYGGKVVSTRASLYTRRRCDGLELERTDKSTDNSYLPGNHTTITRTSYDLPSPCQNADAGTLTVFPNPARGLARILVKDPPEVISVLIFNTTGQLVKSFEMDGNANPLEIEITGMNPGLYVLQLMGDGLRASTRLVVQ
jgi:hypothetical protein